MGASRDLTAGHYTGGSTALLERDTPRRTSPSKAVPEKPAGLRPRVAPHVPRAPRRIGSMQVVSVRGRRVITSNAAKRKFSKLSLMAVPLLILGIFGAMLLSALSTQQTFTIQQLQSQERSLSNEIETLNRNLEDRRAVAEVAAQADQAGLVIPAEPGVIAVDDAGRMHETRGADPAKTDRIVDVNAETSRTDHATSDRNATRDVAGNLSAVPGSASGGPTTQEHSGQPNPAPRAALPSLPGSR